MKRVTYRYPHLDFGVGYSLVVYGQERYVAWGGFDFATTSDTMEIRTNPTTYRRVNECEHCHRADTEEVVAHSWEEAIELGWLMPEEAFKANRMHGMRKPESGE